MPPRAQPTSTRPAPRGTADLEVFERAFSDAEAADLQPSRLVGSPARGLPQAIAALGGAVMASLGRLLEPRCASCGARGTVSLEIHAPAEDESPRLWERCAACGDSWDSVRCEDSTGYC